MPAASRIVVSARWFLAGTIAILAMGLIVITRLASGYYHAPSQYLLMGVLHLASLLVPALIGVDVLGHVLKAVVEATKGEVRTAVRTVAVTLAADGLLLGLALAAGFAVLRWHG